MKGGSDQPLSLVRLLVFDHIGIRHFLQVMKTAIDLSEKLAASVERASEEWWKRKTGTETKVGVHDGAIHKSQMPMVIITTSHAGIAVEMPKQWQ